VRSFAKAVDERLGASPIDALVLNAGRSGDAAGRTVDGFETTFAVNHLAHYLLLRPLVPRANSRTAAGGALAELALGGARPPAGRIYAALRRGDLTWPDPSELAHRDAVMQALWRDSAALAGLGQQAADHRTVGTDRRREGPQHGS
jgi:NAD(P)-dependent dehydrogenase (short-subunit alcohol dehydrogenase family)